MTELRAWTLISKATNRQYAGNRGCGDRPRRLCQYDNQVANSRDVSERDLVLVRNSERLLGIARVERVTLKPGTKKMLRGSKLDQTGAISRELFDHRVASRVADRMRRCHHLVVTNERPKRRD